MNLLHHIQSFEDEVTWGNFYKSEEIPSHLEQTWKKYYSKKKSQQVSLNFPEKLNSQEKYRKNFNHLSGLMEA